MTRSLEHSAGPVDYVLVAGGLGPSPEAYCPCGSQRRIRSCHGTRDGGWVATEPAPLLSGPRTDHAHPECFLAASQDCSPDLTREHWISKSILELLNETKAMQVSGVAWRPGEEFTVPPNALAARVLCGRHNNAISKLDTTGKFVYETLLGYQRALNKEDQRDHAEVALVNGPTLERWLLKLFWGGIASKSLGLGGAPLPGLRRDVDQADLADALTRGGAWPRGWGLYVTHHPETQLREDVAIGVSANTGSDGHAWECAVGIGALVLKIAIARIQPGEREERRHRPGGLAVHYEGHRAHRLLALAWPDQGPHQVVTYTRITGT